MQIITGKIAGAQKVVIYGPEGIGKSTIASKFPRPVFIDTEGSTKHMDVARMPKPSSWTMVLEQVKYFKANPEMLATLVMDTADWAEQLCMKEICARGQNNGIEDFGYGKGYIYLAEEFGRLLNLLEDLIEKGIHVVLTAHAKMRKFEQPDEMGQYDRWELKLQKQTAPLLKEWADLILFANYKTHVINVDGQGAGKGRNKVQGGKRVMYTSHHPCWDAKNRHDLLPELPFDYSVIAHIFNKPVKREPVPPVQSSHAGIQHQTQPSVKQMESVNKENKNEQLKMTLDTPESKPQEPPGTPENIPKELESVPKALRDLMIENKVDVWDIQAAVGKKGYYTEDTPIGNYDPGFINGVLVGAWGQVYKMIQELKEEIPFN